ncbi:MAG: DUF1648 domain-containing protein [Bacteroidetes bacterium]|nr:MAG: DUF1648 domain-containing protein [Bacteroidota bacterium]
MKPADWLKENALLIGLILVSLLIPLLVWNQVPETLPTHWNAAGEPDAYGSKAEALLIMPGVVLFVNLLFWLIPVLDPKKNVPKFQPILRIMQVVMTVFFLALQGLMVADALGYGVRMDLLVPIGVSLLLLVIGNYFGKLRPNYFIGIRTPWTLESPEIWIKTHRLAGRIWVIGSLMLIVLRLVLGGPSFFGIFITVVLLMSFFPIGYSFYLYKNQAPK